jgi:hypothetical protein
MSLIKYQFPVTWEIDIDILDKLPKHGKVLDKKELIQFIFKIKQEIDMETQCNIKMSYKPYDPNHKLWSNIHIFKPLDNYKIFSTMYDELTEIHKNHKKHNIPKNYYRQGGYHIYMEKKVNSKYRNMYAYEVLNIINGKFPILHSYIKKSLHAIITHKGKVSEKIINNLLKTKIKVLFLRYNNKAGKRLHLDNVWRGGGGFICTINIGPKHIYYDLVPISKKVDKKSYRCLVNEGDLLVMDGASRYLYAHSVPFNCDYGNVFKYTIIFLFDVSSYFNTPKEYSPEYGRDMPTSYF